jgi:FkbM family methyltransferase
MELDLSDWIQRNVYLGSYERQETTWVLRQLRRGGTFVDVGANIGYFTALAARIVGSTGRVLAFEPSPYAFPRLQRMIHGNGLTQCTALNAGLSDREGELDLYWNPELRNHSPTMSPGGGTTHARVPVRPLDEVLSEQNIDGIDLMKLDVEGHEPHVLRGAERTLRDRRIAALMIEINDHWLAEHGSSREQLLNQISAAGFEQVAASSDETYLFVQDLRR